MTPITPDNGILFLNQDQVIRNPQQFKTPPPPMWGEEESDYDRDESEPFYDPNKDNFRDSRQKLSLTRRAN